MWSVFGRWSVFQAIVFQVSGRWAVVPMGDEVAEDGVCGFAKFSLHLCIILRRFKEGSIFRNRMNRAVPTCST